VLICQCRGWVDGVQRSSKLLQKEAPGGATRTTRVQRTLSPLLNFPLCFAVSCVCWSVPLRV